MEKDILGYGFEEMKGLIGIGKVGSALYVAAIKGADMFHNWKINTPEDKVFEWGTMSNTDDKPYLIKKAFLEMSDFEKHTQFCLYLRARISEISK